MIMLCSTIPERSIKFIKEPKQHFVQTGSIDGGQSKVIRLRLTPHYENKPFKKFDELFKKRKQEADEFYDDLQKKIKDTDECNIQRQALAGMLWSKQFYYYDLDVWLKGDPAQPPPSPDTKDGS